ncbi:replication-relaxation family protein [Paenibacillus alkaliterrae]|uniref:replication-relaxation family protein n=1 Tax=Paenibacillus alkaliterrae TaxID=320909 RepID=UPI001F1BF9E4|nr:replication-relaxation family protein [Paenibacillus alkaliterrae]MCF2940551.1 replication-relaxation family protein [Paenibacillus alkaliterrae]
MKEQEEVSRGVITVPDEGGKRKRRSSGEYSLGDVIAGLGSRDWRILIDLYLCRLMPQSVAVNMFFLDSPEQHYPEYESVGPDKKVILDDKNRQRALIKARRNFQEMRNGGLIESTNMIPDETDKPAHKRGRIRGETWYYLTARGLRIVEIKIGVLEESRLSKLELDMERAKKEHFWELGKVYLDLRYNWMVKFPEFNQFKDWDWHPAFSVYSDSEAMSVRPDAVLRIGEQVFYVELDRSTEPVQRSPFYTDQVSIEKKLERYRDVLKLSSNKIQRSGIIAFILPDVVYKSRLENIKKAASHVFPNDEQRVLVGKNIGDIIMSLQ